MYKNKKVIYIYGPSGAGSTTIGNLFCEKHDYKLIDTDSYFHFDPISGEADKKYYENPQLRMNELINDLKEADKNVVITGSFWNWKCNYEELISYIDYFIRVSLDPKIRYDRLLKREKERFEKSNPEKLKKIIEDDFKWSMSYETGGLDQRSLKSNIYLENKYNIKPILIDNINSVDESVRTIEEGIKSLH